MHAGKTFLKIKAKSLAEESWIIRKEEIKARNKSRALKAKQKHDAAEKSSWANMRLHEHRVHTVRPVARRTHLARTFITGKPRKHAESTPLSTYEVAFFAKDIHKMALKYGLDRTVTVEQVEDWLRN